MRRGSGPGSDTPARTPEPDLAAAAVVVGCTARIVVVVVVGPDTTGHTTVSESSANTASPLLPSRFPGSIPQMDEAT
jgi:hypothetical protein